MQVCTSDMGLLVASIQHYIQDEHDNSPALVEVVAAAAKAGSDRRMSKLQGPAARTLLQVVLPGGLIAELGNCHDGPDVLVWAVAMATDVLNDGEAHCLLVLPPQGLVVPDVTLQLQQPAQSGL